MRIVLHFSISFTVSNSSNCLLFDMISFINLKYLGIYSKAYVKGMLLLIFLKVSRNLANYASSFFFLEVLRKKMVLRSRGLWGNKILLCLLAWISSSFLCFSFWIPVDDFIEEVAISFNYTFCPSTSFQLRKVMALHCYFVSPGKFSLWRE